VRVRPAFAGATPLLRSPAASKPHSTERECGPSRKRDALQGAALAGLDAPAEVLVLAGEPRFVLGLLLPALRDRGSRGLGMVVLASTTVLALALVGAEHDGFDTLRVARLAVLRRVPVSGIRAVGQRARNDDNGNQGRHQKQPSHTTPPRKVPQWPEYDRVPCGAQALSPYRRPQRARDPAAR